MKTVAIQLRFARSDEFPFVVELTTLKDKQVHRFGDSHSRDEFVSGVRSLARLVGQKVLDIQ